MLENWFKSYLEKVYEKPITGQQLVETKRAFVAGVSSTLVNMIHVDEGEEENFISRLEKEILSFWDEEMKNNIDNI